jgi:hypothetical protein
MDSKIQYRKGTYNGTDDALSRKLVYSDAAVADSSCCAMSCAQPTWLQEVLVSYDADPYAQQLLTRLAVDNSTEQDFCLHNSILRYKGRVWVGADQSMQQKLLSAFHSSALGGSFKGPCELSKIEAIVCMAGYEISSSYFCSFLLDLPAS